MALPPLDPTRMAPALPALPRLAKVVVPTVDCVREVVGSSLLRPESQTGHRHVSGGQKPVPSLRFLCGWVKGELALPPALQPLATLTADQLKAACR